MKYVLALIASIFMLVSVPTFADNTVIATQGQLSDEQKAQLAAEAAKMLADAAAQPKTVVPAPTTAEHVKQWVDIGAEIGNGLASTAKSLGVAANEFINTPVGKLTAIIIMWHFMGASLVHIVFGLLWFLVTVPLWIWLFRRWSARVTRTVYEKGKGPNGVTKIVDRQPTKMTGDQAAATAVSAVLIVLVGLFTIFSF